MTSWEPLQQQAKYLEGKLEADVQAFEAMANKMNSWEFAYDRENPYDGHGEQDLSAVIDRSLNELSDCIHKMKLCPSLTSHQEGLIRRYSEINFDLRSEYKRLLQTIQKKKESLELFGSSSGGQGSDTGGRDSPQYNSSAATSKLLRERGAISASQKGVAELVQQAHNAKESLTNQRSLLSSAGSGLSSISSAASSFTRLIDSMQKKKFRDNVILACCIGVMFFFTIWWVFLR